MAISFNSIPSNQRLPAVVAEFDNSQASQGPALLAYRGLIIGQKLAAGIAIADTIYKVANVDQVITLAGRGSMLHRQALGWFASNKSTEVWIGVLADNAGGVAATGTIVVAGPATGTGTIYLYLGGERITVAVTSGDASTAIATNIAAAINLNLDIPVTATVASSTVTLLFRHKGLAGNSYDMRANYRDGDALPAGVTLTFTAMGGVIAGTLNPVLTGLIAAASDLWFQVPTHPYTDATSLAAIEAEMASRFGPTRQKSGVAITSAAGTFSALTSLGGGRNSPHSTILAQPGVSPLTPPMEFAAEGAGIIAAAGAADPARPFQTLVFARALPPPETDQFDDSERNLLLFDGISPTRRTAGGGVALERVITTYQISPAGADDTSYLDVTTMLTILYLRYSWIVRLKTKYPRHKLASDGTRFGSGQAVITPKIGKAEACGWFRQMEQLGLVEGFDQFKADTLSERDISDPNRMNWLLLPDLVNQFIVGATRIAFRL